MVIFGEERYVSFSNMTITILNELMNLLSCIMLTNIYISINDLCQENISHVQNVHIDRKSVV